MSSGAASLIAVLVMLAVLVYTYVGYPAAIGLLARWRGRRPAAPPDPTFPSVTVCLPVFDGAAYLPAKIASLLAQDYPGPIEILVYCDGCTDDTEAVARALAAEPRTAGRMRVLVNPRRLGKPSGLNTLRAEATGELLLLNDVRQPLDPGSIRALAAAVIGVALLAGARGTVFSFVTAQATRGIQVEAPVALPWLWSAALGDPTVGGATGRLVLTGDAGSGVYWHYENWIRQQESAFRGVVGMTGSIAMVRRRDLRPLGPDLILDDVWIPMSIALTGRRTVLVPQARAFDTAFEDQHEMRRKVRTLAGNYQLFARMPALLVPFANPIWFETFSHKILRLVAPWVLIALALVSLAGVRSSRFIALLFAAQLAFYAAAAAGRRLGRIAGLARTFVVLNLAALLGLWRFLTGRQRVTW